ncbi:hypothetical protein PsYK624_145760 [Phanerochaete sordida]|uniref:DUF6533 domain-containing protein n=1 Tax=Phanerochaete sordida TaxID=48140 RepID=A0A9P3GNU0_9APHY|nr:hypothetical protein PsYK624_145760 [Phanerochaete sordida]
MSGPAPGVQAALEEYYTGNRVQAGLLGLVAYEYVITFSQEVEYVWQKPLSVTSVLLLSTRWVMVVFQALWVTPTGVASCRRLEPVSQLLLFASWAQIAVFSGLRVYALWHDSRLRYILLVVVILLGCIPIATNSVLRLVARASAIHRHPIYVVYIPRGRARASELHKSVLALSPRPAGLMRLTLVLYFTRSGALASDLLVVVLTWTKTFMHWKQQRRAGLKSSVATLLLRDGTIYFGAILALDIAQMVTYSVKNVNGYANIADNFLQGLPPVLLQRFMLNLRQFADAKAPGRDAEELVGSDSTVRFRARSRLGNAGEPLSFYESDMETDEDGSTQPSTLVQRDRA